MILLLAIGGMTVLDKLLTAAVMTTDDLCNHALAYQSSVGHYRNLKGGEFLHPLRPVLELVLAIER